MTVCSVVVTAPILSQSEDESEPLTFSAPHLSLDDLDLALARLAELAPDR